MANSEGNMRNGAIVTAFLAAALPAWAGTVDQAPFGTTKDGKPIQIFTLTNAHGLKARVLDLGGIVCDVEAPGRDGKMVNVILCQKDLANLEATRYAPGRKNHIEIEINGEKGSLYFNFEDMNKLKFYNVEDPKDRRGFREIQVTERDGILFGCMPTDLRPQRLEADYPSLTELRASS